MDKLIGHFKSKLDCPYHQIAYHYTMALEDQGKIAKTASMKTVGMPEKEMKRKLGKEGNKQVQKN